MRSVTTLEAKTNFNELLKRVAQGEEVIITEHGKPVARLVPERPRDLGAVRKAVDGLRELREEIAKHNEGKPPITDAEIKSWIEEGRK